MATPASLADPPAEQAFDSQQPSAAGSPSGPRDGWPSRPPLVRLSLPRHRSSASSSPSSSAAAGPATGTANPPSPSPSPFSTSRRQRHQSPAHSPTRLLDGEFDFPMAWGDDSADDVSLLTPTAFLPVLPGFTSEGQFLGDLADNEFSSPSGYPSFLNPPARTTSQAGQPRFATTAHPGSVAPRRSSACDRAFAPPSRSTTQLTVSSVGHSQNSLFTNEFGDELLSESTQSSFMEMPPPRLQDIKNAPGPAPVAKRRRMTGTGCRSADSKPLAWPQSSDDDIFGDNNLDNADLEELTTIDLTEATEVPEELKKPEVDNRIKISAFQCVICMDDVTTLTVTHCGHLYCQQCLHSSLHVDATRGKCPMCRAKIDMKPRSSYNTKTKGFWPLELKLMTATKKGKRKADNLS
ncbi:Helicase-like transcription factor [Tolypocladium capitatum]|uniref:Helicase-like transcription factor n=1 Tax=Tolypocladium capitatum TaxID=45235 RepID=A0A2K3Q8Z2_9HYPO|nr:Helicase-like transcription factor [Tolypocladium capitatum]